MFAGFRLVTSYLCYHDAGATLSEHRIRDWLREHPASICGFVLGLMTLAHSMLAAETGNREQALLSHQGITRVIASMRPHTERGEIQSKAEFVEGFRSGAALLGHRIRDDQEGQDLVLHRILETWSLSWGAIQGLTVITVAALEYYDNPTEFLHDLHSFANTVTAHAEPHATMSA